MNDNERYRNAPGHRGVDTSIEAANDIAPKIGRLQRMTLEAVQSAGPQGLTSDEAAEVLEELRWSVQPRLSELKAKGLIVDSGLRRRNTTGKRAIVWVVPGHKQDLAA